MSLRSVLSLLVGLFAILDPTVSAGQGRSLPAEPSAARRVVARSPALRAPVREPSYTIRRFPSNSPDSSEFSQFVRAAGTIFAGSVTRVQFHPGANGQSVATVAITFHIENAIRGATSGREFTIFEWSGLWSAGQRYRVGERVFLFLYPRSKLGLTSSVAGPLGRFALNAQQEVVPNAQQISTFRTHPVVGGKSRLHFSDFALAVRQASEEEPSRGDHEK